MQRMTRCLAALGLGLSVWLASAPPAAAQASKFVPLNGVKDRAGLFSPEAVIRARDEIQEIKRVAKKDSVIETFAEPDPQYKGQKPDQFADTWALQNFKDHRVDGIYVLICKEPKILRIAVGNVTRDKGIFTTEERNKLRTLMLEKLKASESAADEKKAQELRDQALAEGVAYVRTNIEPARAAAPGQRGDRAAGGDVAPRQSWFAGPMGWICIGLVVLAVVWLIVGIIRGMSGSGSPGYAGGGGGGGGGGFFSSMLGGLFGAAAGMWLYHNMFGGGTPSAGAGDFGGGGANDAGGDVGGGASTTGGDYGADAGGDAGGGDAGGGDWGGGGGGDWGGGGGDFGGGGGGDW